MPRQSLLSPSSHRTIGDWLVIVFAAILVLLGAVILAGGIWLIALGGSWYYGFAGIGLLASGILMLSGSPAGVWVYLLTFAVTLVWAFWEVGFNGWALVPRVVAPTILAIAALFCIPVLRRRQVIGERATDRMVERRPAPRTAGQPARATGRPAQVAGGHCPCPAGSGTALPCS